MYQCKRALCVQVVVLVFWGLFVSRCSAGVVLGVVGWLAYYTESHWVTGFQPVSVRVCAAVTQGVL